MKLNYLNKTKVDWDYSSLAKTYDKRIDVFASIMLNYCFLNSLKIH